MKGGIGNQLFQYAFALRLANGNPRNVTCLLDYFRVDSKHGGFALQHLLGAEVLSADAPPAERRWAYVNADALADTDLSILQGSTFDIFIDGYFQHVANILPAIDKLRSMFSAQFDQDLYEKKLTSLHGRPSQETVVAIHLRRGDYLNPDVRSAHGIPRPESMVGCLARVPTPGYCAVVFSDSEVAIDLPCRAMRLVAPQPRSLLGDIDELRLMACCDWIIASNSTFSYWAGMLSNRVQQIFLPDPWMRSGSIRTASLLTDRFESYGTQLL
ncbi:MAG TPA: alpha-1,2-fucosyltransferase [Steroidobacteraceae bacterium]